MSELETLFPYQTVGAQFLSERPQAFLADDMGLGKSAQGVAACDLVGARRILILCPANVRVNWSREFDRFSPFDRPVAIIAKGTDAPELNGVTISSYDLLDNDKVFKALRNNDWDVLILDEAHNLKNRAAGRTKSVYGARGASGLAICAKNVWRLSGTPAPNNASELWTHLHSAGTTAMPYYKFVETYCSGYDSGYGFKITGHQNTEHLKQVLAPFMLRRLKEDVMTELPPITFSTVTIERSAVELDPFFYAQMLGKGEEKFLAELKEADLALKAAIKQVKSHEKSKLSDMVTMLEGMAISQASLRRYIGLAKVPIFCEMIRSELVADPTKKIVIFAWYKDVVESCRVELAKFGAVTLYGGTEPERRQRNIDKFANDPKTRVFIGNIKAVVGVDGLQKHCNEGAFIEESWTPADNAQAAMRIHRIGQEKPVRIRFFSCAGSVDELITAALIRKTKELAKIF